MVLPVGSFAEAKTGLAGQVAGHHAELAHAFYLDTLRAVRATPAVGVVVVVTSDPLAASQARTLGAVTATERVSGRGAECAATRGVTSLAPDAPVAVLVADLPALRPDELHQALTVASQHRRSFVADSGGKGATALIARRASYLWPALGSGPRGRVALGGAHEIGLPPDAGLRLAVDTPRDLAAARERGLGLYSAAVLSLWAMPLRPRALGAALVP